MARIALVTDSTADLSIELVEQHGITIVPLNVHFQDQVYKDGELDNQTFFNKLKNATEPPRTSQPSPGDFHAVYKELLAAGFQKIISVHISKELSGTWQSACIARDMLSEEDIHVLDSKSASMGLGLIVINIAQSIAAGETWQRVLELGQRLVSQQQVIFGVDTLEYLHRNGRIGRASKLVGELLSVKPILHVDSDGIIAALAKIRGKNKFLPCLVERTKHFVGQATQPVDVAVVHAQDAENARLLVQQLKDQLEMRALYTGEIGAVIGTHAGPGALGVIVQEIDLP